MSDRTASELVCNVDGTRACPEGSRPCKCRDEGTPPRVAAAATSEHGRAHAEKEIRLAILRAWHPGGSVHREAIAALDALLADLEARLSRESGLALIEEAQRWQRAYNERCDALAAAEAARERAERERDEAAQASDGDLARARWLAQVVANGEAEEKRLRTDLAAAEAARERAHDVIPSLISYALAAPTNAASERARDMAVERARAVLAGGGGHGRQEDETA